MLRTSFVATLGLGFVACATPQNVTPVAAAPLQLTSNERIQIDHLLVIVDASASLAGDNQFLDEKVLVEAYFASVPDGQYEAGAVAFGGFERQSHPLTLFQRSELQANAAQIEHLREGTPIYKVLEESREPFSARSGRAAVVIFSDGEITDEFGRDVELARTTAAAQQLAADYRGEMCFHTVQVGDSVEGGRALREIASVTTCGTARTASATRNQSALHGFHREVFMGARMGLPAVGAGPPALRGSGPWSVRFAFDSATVDAAYGSSLGQIAGKMKRDPDARLRLSGHTDGQGDAAYNEHLSMRRAEAVRDAMVVEGVDADRIELDAYGPEMPAVPNDTAAHRRANRRTEIELVR